MQPDSIEIRGRPPAALRELREEWLASMNAQVVHHSWHTRAFLDLFEIRIRGARAGYGAVGAIPPEPRDIVKELHLQPAHRALAAEALRRLVAASGARRIEAQTNDALLCDLLRAHASHVTEEALLFEDGGTTSLAVPDATVVPLAPEARARVFAHEVEPVGGWGLVVGDEVVATGGYFTHYNPPYGDVFMEVAASHRRRGYGSYLVQEVKARCRQAGHVPAARCGPANVASARTLERAGFVRCGAILRGRIADLRHHFD